MSKFKMGDKVRLKVGAEQWSDSLKGKVIVVSNNKINGSTSDTVVQCVVNYPDDFELVQPAPTPTPHVHHDMIVEWAKNSTRIVQFRTSVNYPWTDCSDVTWNPITEYRFKPPERVFPTTSLTDDELTGIVEFADTARFVDDYRNIANAAIKQYILEQENILDMEKA